MVIAHVFGKGHEVGLADGADLIEDLEHPVGEVVVDLVQQFGLVVEGEKVSFDAEEISGVPEEAFEGQPDDGVAATFELSPLFELMQIERVFGE